MVRTGALLCLHSTHQLTEAGRVPLVRRFATSYLCGELYLFVGWFTECLFEEGKFSLLKWEPAHMACCDLRQDKSMAFLLLA